MLRLLGGDDAGVVTAFAKEEKLQHELYQAPPPVMPPQEVRTPRVRNMVDMGDLGPSTSAAAAEAVAEAGGEEAVAAEQAAAVAAELDGLFEHFPLSDGGIDAGNIFGKPTTALG